MHVGHLEILIELVVDLDHGRIDTCPKALHLGHGEKTIRCGLTSADTCHGVSKDCKESCLKRTEILFDSLENIVGAADHARRGGADLHVVLANRIAVDGRAR